MKDRTTAGTHPPDWATLRELALAANTLASSIASLAQPTGWLWRAGSPAAVAGSHESIPGGPRWTRTPHQRAFCGATYRISQACECLRGLADAVGLARPYGAMTLARTMAESAGRAWYLLDREADERERVRRHVNDEIFSFREAARLFEDGLPGAAASRRNFEDAAEQLLSDGGIHGFTRKRTRAGEYLVDEERPELWADDARPSIRRLLERAMTSELVERQIDEAAAITFFYRVASAVSHAAEHGDTALRENIQVDGEVQGDRPSPDRFRQLLVAPITIFCVMGNEALYQFGWEPTTLWESSRDDAYLRYVEAARTSSNNSGA